MSTQTNERIERFKTEAAGLNLKVGNPNRERLLQWGGVGLMVLAVVVALIGYQVSLTSDDARDIQSYIVLAVAMVAVAVIGAVVFLRYSLGRFLRLWLLRQLYEGQSHIDQVVEAVERRDR